MKQSIKLDQSNKLRQQARELEASALNTEVNQFLIDYPDTVESFKKQLSEFDNDSYDDKKYSIQFDQFGMLESLMELDFSEFDDINLEFVQALVEKLGYEFYHVSEQSKSFYIGQCLGEPTIVNFSPDRNCYTVYSEELNLKLLPTDLHGNDNSEKFTHALYLIECAMRKHGYFGNIVEIDYYGGFNKFLSTNLGTLSDTELTEYGKTFDNKESE